MSGQFVVTGEEATELVGLSQYELRKYQKARERGIVHMYALVEARRERGLAGPRTKGPGPKPKTKFSTMAALTYAAEHASGCNADANVGRTENVEGAARLCAWALARQVRGVGARTLPPVARQLVDAMHAESHRLALTTKAVIETALISAPDQWHTLTGVRTYDPDRVEIIFGEPYDKPSPIAALHPSIICPQCRIRVRASLETGLCRICETPR